VKIRAGLFIAAALAVAASGAEPPREGKKGGRGEGRRMEVRMPVPLFRTEVPAHPFDLILGRPTDRAITLSVLTYDDLEGFVAWGPEPSAPTGRSATTIFRKGEPVELVLGPLQPGTRYHYRFHSRTPGAAGFGATEEYSFTTARLPGSRFTFTVQADPHLDFGIEPAIYVKSLRHAVAAGTDFHVDLGDTFMTDKYPHYTDALPQYLAQRYYFGLVGTRAPVFLAIGNHDGEQPARGGAKEGSMSVWSARMRTKYFPNPVPDEFYRGNVTPDPVVGPLENYYAWEWGDALFVVLDPFWYSTRGGRGDNWSRSLGRTQYDWLARTLERSRAKYKFVFLHHLVGGETPEGRGGAEAAAFFEWGGHDLDGRDTFAQHRPGWPTPIHSLLVQHHVSAVFHGHDHLYVQQERDGIIYQLVPQPGHGRFDNTRSAAEYGYKSGVIQGASGILRVHVSPERTQVEYVRAYPDSAEDATRRSGLVSHSYVIAPGPD
jgi:3',5'-cyclic AMP phosphodiesterase CpdA